MTFKLKPVAEMTTEPGDDGLTRPVLRIGDQVWPAQFLDAREVAIDINRAHFAAMQRLVDYAETLETLLERAIEERRCDHAAEPCSWCGPVKAALGFDE